jgi:hypothetical protein
MYFFPLSFPLPASLPRPLYWINVGVYGKTRKGEPRRGPPQPLAAQLIEHGRKDSELSLAPCCPHNVLMIPKPIQFLLLLPLAFGPVAPRFFLGLFALALFALVLWWLRLVVDMVLGGRAS